MLASCCLCPFLLIDFLFGALHLLEFSTVYIPLTLNGYALKLSLLWVVLFAYQIAIIALIEWNW
jgi:hypothetical protein